ncbi:small acid-soluble spore protein Tlp [Bacillus alkalicellulosilyticus]|uniref:small acid-soluble spore protein Tlp n=1 Tax=Alkalihalobacterium alkalicellulosilyticum TaxID=1912214 RepID=UPI000997334B|nr:small acid-soluble spore protein Tlp [Bacillus alkalicellulosilyticus]
MANHQQPKPDDRSDNVEKLQNMIHNTIENIEASEETLRYTDSEEERQNIEAKNRRREDSIESFRNEIRDEARDNK